MAASALAGVGLFGTVLLTDDSGVTPGHMMALDSGTIWGFTNAGGLAAAMKAEGEFVPGYLAAGQVLGTLGGELYYRVASPTAGRVAMMTSVANWYALGTVHIHALTNFYWRDKDNADIWWTELFAYDLGLVAGSILADV